MCGIEQTVQSHALATRTVHQLCSNPVSCRPRAQTRPKPRGAATSLRSSCGCSTTSICLPNSCDTSDVRALVELAAYYEAPGVLSWADVHLASMLAKVMRDNGDILQDGSPMEEGSSLKTDELLTYLKLATTHRMRR